MFGSMGLSMYPTSLSPTNVKFPLSAAALGLLLYAGDRRVMFPMKKFPIFRTAHGSPPVYYSLQNFDTINYYWKRNIRTDASEVKRECIIERTNVFCCRLLCL